MSKHQSVPLIIGAVIFLGFLLVARLTDRSAPDTARSSSTHVPIVIYLVDTLRADRLGLYGYERPTSPNLEQLARDSVVFEQAYAPSPWTLPSVASLITSTFICEHGVSARKKLSGSLTTMAERLRGIGYFTGGFYSNVFVGPIAGLNRGYEDYQFIGGNFGEAVGGLLGRTGDRPFFMYLHTMEPHDPHKTPNPWINQYGKIDLYAATEYEQTIKEYLQLRSIDSGRRSIGTTDTTAEQRELMAELAAMRDSVRSMYDGSVRWADENLGDVIGTLKQANLWDRAIFVFVADHGEEFEDHGGWNHGQSVYEELVRSPMIIHFPGDRFAGRRISDVVSLIDVMPTIFDYLDEPQLCDECRGTSLLGLLRGETVPGDSGARVTALRMNDTMYYEPWQRARGNVNVAVRKEQFKAIWNKDHGTTELYDLSADPAETTDLVASQPDLARSLGKMAEDWLVSCQQRRKKPEVVTSIPDETREQLRAIGYFD